VFAEGYLVFAEGDRRAKFASSAYWLKKIPENHLQALLEKKNCNFSCDEGRWAKKKCHL
jgi:hypothetical protein